MKKSPFQNIDPALKAEIKRENQRYREAVSQLEANMGHPDYGFFGPQSISWKIYREPAVVLGGMRAVLMQTAHPAIAQGVEENSNFRNNLFMRGRRTIQALYQLVFGNLTQARGLAARVYNVHHFVRGTVSNETNSRWSGASYRANDPELLLWVAATVAETTLDLYQSLFYPLSPQEQMSYIEELNIGLTLNGLPKSDHFDSTKHLKTYINSVLEGSDLAVGPIGMGIAETLFTNRLTPSRFDERFTVGLLPGKIRDIYQIPWNDEKEGQHRKSLDRMRSAIHLIPGKLRYVPAYHQALVRANQAAGHPPSRYGQVLSWVDRKFYVPLGLHAR
ncbi:MAG: oxygenase MpaB family protein [Chloroflexota bacterium]